MTPTRFGKYEIVDKIGHGAMGEVYKAIDPVLGREVAVKTMSQAVGTDPELRRRFHREAQSAGRLNHPNIITVYEFGEEQGQVFMAMELLEGRDLKEVIAVGPPLSLEEKVSVLSQVAEALAFAHAKGVVHRDIKPANIHLQPGGHVKVMDFGLARIAASDMTRAGSIMGTPNYMSPEQVRGETATARSDVFSLGALFYELLTGRKAFQGESLPAVLFQALQQQPPPIESLRPDVPEPLRRLVERALAKDPASRFRDGAELRDALREVRQAIGPSSGASLPAIAASVPAATAPGSVAAPSVGNLALANLQQPPDPATLAAHADTKRPKPAPVDAERTEILSTPRGARPQALPPPRRIGAVGLTVLATGGGLVLAAGLGGAWLLLAPRPSPAPAPRGAGAASARPSVATAGAVTPTVSTLVADPPVEAASVPAPAAQPAAPSPPAPAPSPRSTDGLVREGRRRLVERDLRGARAAAQAALAAVPGDGASLRLLDEATAALEAGEVEARRARTALDTGDAAQASAALQRLGQVDPRHPQLGLLGLQLTTLLERLGRERAAAPATTVAAAPPTTLAAAPAGAMTTGLPSASVEPEPARPAAAGATPAQKEAAQRAIRSSLEIYRSAFERRNADALRGIHPGVDYQHYKGLFANVQSYEVKLQVQELNVEADGGSAVCLVTYSPKPKPAGRMAPVRQRFVMRRSGEVWIIARIESLGR